MDRRIGYVGAYDDMRTVHEDVVKRSEDAVVALMVEKVGAVDDLAEILAVDGVDAITFGPSDYSMSAGIPGEIDSEEVNEAQKQAFETAIETDVEPIVELSVADDCEEYLDQYDVKHFNMGVDVSVLDNWWRTEGRKLRDRLGD
jgi:2-keto-3-deoxy-L-rhamnonate aldolase RhmA